MRIFFSTFVTYSNDVWFVRLWIFKNVKRHRCARGALFCKKKKEKKKKTIYYTDTNRAKQRRAYKWEIINRFEIRASHLDTLLRYIRLKDNKYIINDYTFPRKGSSKFKKKKIHHLLSHILRILKYSKLLLSLSPVFERRVNIERCICARRHL